MAQQIGIRTSRIRRAPTFGVGKCTEMYDNPAITGRRAYQTRLTDTESCRIPRLQRCTHRHEPHCTRCAQASSLRAADLIPIRRGGHGSQCKLRRMHLNVTDVDGPQTS